MKKLIFISALLGLILMNYSYADELDVGKCIEHDGAKRCVLQSKDKGATFEVLTFPRNKGYKLEVLANPSENTNNPVTLTTVLNLVQNHSVNNNIVAAINGFNYSGSGYTAGEPRDPCTLLVNDGKQLSSMGKNMPNDGTPHCERDKGEFVLQISNELSNDGKFALTHFGTSDKINSNEYGQDSFFGSTTLVIGSGSCLWSTHAPGKGTAADYVSVIGFSDNHIILVVSRNEVQSFQQICDVFPNDTRYAYLMDGGGSVTLVTDSQLDNNSNGFQEIIEHEAWWRGEGARAVAYAVVVSKRDISPPTCDFSDINNSSEFELHTSTTRLCELGIIKKNYLFRKDDNVTRAEFLKMALLANGLGKEVQKPKYQTDTWEKLIAYLSQYKTLKNLIETTFDVKITITDPMLKKYKDIKKNG